MASRLRVHLDLPSLLQIFGFVIFTQIRPLGLIRSLPNLLNGPGNTVTVGFIGYQTTVILSDEAAATPEGRRVLRHQRISSFITKMLTLMMGLLILLAAPIDERSRHGTFIAIIRY